MKTFYICLFSLVTLSVALASDAPSPTLPVFTDGQWKGNHAVYECDTFRALMDSRGRLRIQVLDQGKPVGKPFTWAAMSCNYHIPGTLHSPSRPVISYKNPSEPVMQPEKIVLEGLLKDDVPFRVEYRFRGQTITASGSCDDPRKLEFPSSFRLGTSFPANWSIHPYVPQVERETILAGCFLDLKENRDGKTVRSHNPYWESMRFYGSIEEVEIVGVYGSRRVNVEPKSGGLGGHLGAGHPPWVGFSFSFGCPNNTLSPRGSLVLSIK